MPDSIQIQADKPVDGSTPAEGAVKDLGGGVTSIQVDPAQKKVEEQKTATDNGVPEKFRKADGSLDSDALLKSYRELESKQGGQKKDEPAPKAETKEPTKDISADDMGKLNAEFAKDGKLSDETYRSLAGKGLSKEVVDNYIAGQKARVEQYTNTLRSHVGGKDSLDSIIAWAGTNLTEAEIATANKALSSMDEAQAKLTLDGLKARYVAANGTEPSLVNGAGTTTISGVKPFASKAQIVEAMSDKRYRNDPAYRDEVYKRLAVTK